jgi:uncharacterized protein YbjT (DUF2867 family)
MNVLLCGGRGFLGRHIAAALVRAGHTVQSVSRHGRPAVDFTQATSAAYWHPLLNGVDAVVNAVGVLRDSTRAPMSAIHAAAPRALADACAHAGVRRVVHISALGIDGNPTRYASTKREADQHWLALTDSGQLDATVLRPSLVFGPEGDSTRLFLALARLPVLPLPRPVLRARVQPLHAGDLAEAVTRLVSAPSPCPGLLPLGGPSVLTLGHYIASLRAQLGQRPARMWPLPEALTWLSARLGDAIPLVPWCTETLSLLATDNVTDGQHLKQLLGRAPLAPERFVSTLISKPEQPPARM